MKRWNRASPVWAAFLCPVRGTPFLLRFSQVVAACIPLVGTLVIYAFTIRTGVALAETTELVVFAAASMTETLTEIKAAYEAEQKEFRNATAA